MGSVPASAVPRLLADHDVFIMPSRYEGFGLTILEAMAAGVVPVVSRIAGVTDTIVTHAQDGLLFPMGNAQAAASLIKELCEEPLCLLRLSAAARSRARNDCFQHPVLR